MSRSRKKYLASIHEFVAHVRANEPGALCCDVWQEADHRTRFDASAAFRRV